MRKILSGIMSIAMAAGLVTPVSAKAERIIITQTLAPIITEMTTTTEVVETTPAEPRVIYRDTFEVGGTEGYANGAYKYTLSAKDNGNIHIDVYCTKRSSYSHVLGSIAFNDVMIASLGEQGYAGNSTFKTEHNVKNIVTYDEDKIIYSATHGDTYMGNLYATYDFYVKEPYLTTNQTIYISENEVTIPFGEPPVDYQTQIENLTAENETLKSQLNSLTDFLNKYGNRAYGDMNDDGFCDARDASILLTYYARQSVGEVITLDQLIEEQKGN